MISRQAAASMAWRVLLPIKNINFFPEKKLDKGIPRVYNSSRIQEMCAHSSADRVPGYEPVGRRFKSCWARQKRTHICLRQVWVLFWRSVPLPRNVKYASQVKCTSCAKCDFGTIGGGTLHFTSLHFVCEHDTSQRRRRCFTWRSQTSRNIEKENLL